MSTGDNGDDVRLNVLRCWADILGTDCNNDVDWSVFIPL